MNAANDTSRLISMLFIPAVAAVLLLFVLPVALFFVRSAAEAGGLFAFMDLVARILKSTAVQNALFLTLFISLAVTLLTLVIGYPIAYYLTVASSGAFNIVLLCIVVPYFTSIIVRTYSWMVLLGRNGVLNQALQQWGLIDRPLALLYNINGVLIGMTYVMLPYMVLTLYSAMKRIDKSLLSAAAGMGANGFYAFRKVYLPLSVHGILSGALIVFILCLGFFVTPALMGGPSNVMIAMLIQHEVDIVMNWPAAAAISLVLFTATMILYYFYYKLTDMNKLMGH